MKIKLVQKTNLFKVLTTYVAFIFNARFSICFDNATAGLQLGDFTPTNPPVRTVQWQYANAHELTLTRL